MSDERIRLVRNDTRPQVELWLTDESTGAAMDLTAGSVTLHLRKAGQTELALSRQAVIPEGDESLGRAVIVWQTNDLTLEAGVYDGEVEVIFADGARQTVYEFLSFQLRDDIGQAVAP
jgi:hypothetical protein